MNRPRQIERQLGVPPISISRHVVCKIMCSVGAHGPETGGILLGPIDSSEITDFYFDVTAQCTGATYSPDHLTLRRKMKEEWLPAGIDFKGFVHSHPGSFDRLSDGDLRYIRRLLDKNPDIEAFAAPIVIPREFRLRPIVVLREEPQVQRPTTLRII
jgi:proteasome lid subunit RPN8/RPN11